MVTVPTPTAAPPRKLTLVKLIDREDKRRKRRRFVGWGALLLVPLALVAAYLALRPKPLPMAARFRTGPVSRGEVLREVRATGHVEAVTTVQVGAEISGRIASVEVDFNDRVKAGQVLARFDRTALSAQLAQTEATLAAARAGLEQARTDRTRVANDLARADAMFAGKVMAQADHDNAAAALRLAEQRVAAAEAQVEAQRAANALARTNIDHAIIRAPIDGVVITRNIDPGQTVASVLQTPVLFTVAADLRKMRVVAAVDEADTGEVAVGQSATFTVTAWPDRTFHGTVTEVRSSPVIVQDVVTYGTVIEVDNLDLALKPGMTASARILTDQAHDVLRVPAAALRFSPPGAAAAEGPGLWVLRGAAPERLAVKPGVSDGELTAVADGPVAAGQQVLVELTPEGRKAYAAGR